MVYGGHSRIAGSRQGTGKRGCQAKFTKTTLMPSACLLCVRLTNNVSLMQRCSKIYYNSIAAIFLQYILQ